MKKLILFALLSFMACKKQYENLLGPRKVKISSIVVGESLTIKNNTVNQVYMENWKLTYEYDYFTTSTTIYTIHNTTLINGQTITYTTEELGFKPGVIYSHIYLYDNNGNLIDKR